ncbi:MAG: ABC transporter permease [Planctomycetes bacterium]|nr:ABC transporter permease [Planctomycetota bacterium]MCP4837911.1 ABC transporter permease [Planctomycetota bacterium]
MIHALVKTKLLALVRDPIALMLTCLLPIVFYAIFAGIFGGGGGTSGGVGSGIVAVLVDQDDSLASKSLIKALEDAGSGLRVSTTQTIDGVTSNWTADAARHRVMKGKAAAAIIVPHGFGISFGPSDHPPVEVLVDPSNPIAGTMIPGLLQQAAMQGMQSTMMLEGMRQFEKYGGPLTPRQKTAAADLASLSAATSTETSEGGSGMLLPVTIEDVSAASNDEPPRTMSTYYAAAIGVMFLLFSVAGASGSLLEDKEAGILDRLLFTPLGMTRLLLANGCWMTIMAICSMAILFVFAALVFSVGPWSGPRLIACAVVTVVTAAATSSLGLLLATACRSRAQLAGISTVVILAMSAIGGSMIPRFAMPVAVQEIGWYTTFNAWAVEAYLEVFWYTPTHAGLGEIFTGLTQPLAVLVGMAIVFFAVARLLARRWEQV